MDTGILDKRSFFLKASNSLLIGIMFSQDQKIAFTNNNFNNTFGYTDSEELVGQPISILVPDHLRDEILDININRVRNNILAEKYEYMGLKKDGTIFPIEISATLLEFNDEIYSIFAVTDISESKRIQEEAIKNYNLYRSMFENAHEAIVIIDYDTGKNIKVNDQAEKLFNMKESELCQLGPFDLCPEYQMNGRKTSEYGLEMMTRALRGEKPIYEWVYLINGLAVECEVRLIALSSDGQRLLRANLIDISSRKEVQRFIQESEIKYRNLVEHAPEAIFVYDHDIEQIIEVNNRAEILLGRQKKEIIGENPSILYGKEPTIQINHEILGRIERVLNNNEIIIMEIDVYNTSGEYIPCETRMVKLPSKGKIIRASFLDISERIKAQNELQVTREQLFQANKLESIGRISASIGHDFNNLLFVIDGYANILAMTAGETDRENIDQIIEATSKASNLVKQLLSFSRKRILNPKKLNLNTTLIELYELIETVLPENVASQLKIEEDLFEVYIDKSQLEQVIINLIMNAKDAMPNGGSLEFRANNSQRMVDGSPGNYVLISIIDTGIGISEEKMKRIFEPFYTSKDEGLGSGLGLSTVHGILEQSNCMIEVDSQLNKGSTFTIIIPQIKDEMMLQIPEIREAVDEVSQQQMNTSNNFNIMIVEDDEAIAKLLSEILVSNGFDVISFSDIDASISYFDSNMNDIDLIISDIIMPKMNGVELSKYFLKLKSDQKIIFMTGYSRLEMINEIKEMGFEILEKPFKTDLLLDKLFRILQ